MLIYQIHPTRCFCRETHQYSPPWYERHRCLRCQFPHLPGWNHDTHYPAPKKCLMCQIYRSAGVRIVLVLRLTGRTPC